MRVGVLSDTHGVLHKDVLAALAGVEQILHAGDVGGGVLDRLQAIAPVVAVRGNTDYGSDLPPERLVDIEERRLLVIHQRGDALALHQPLLEGLAAVIYGHSHKPEIVWQDGVLYLNPGAAGPSRFGLPRSLAILEVGAELRPEIVPLGAAG